MGYRIRYAARAQRDLDAAFRWIANDAPRHAEKWQAGLLEAVERLRYFPLSGTIAPESSTFGVEVRRLLYGKGHGTHKIFYTVSGKTVIILHLRHGSRRELRSNE